MTAGTVLPKDEPPGEAHFQALIVQALARLCVRHGRGAVSDAMGRSGRQLDNVFGGAMPKADALFALLAIDATALDELLAAYGLRVCPQQGGSEDDLKLAAGVSEGLAKLLAANADGVRDHNETLAIAGVLRPVMGALTRIISDADELTRPRH